MGNKNITAFYCVIASIFLDKYIKKTSLLYLVYLLIFIYLGLYLESRAATIIYILLLLYLNVIHGKKNYLSKKLNYLILFIALSIPFIFVDRFINLFTGDYLIRALSWLRLIYAGSENFIFGYGLGSVPIIFNKYQNIFPELHILIGNNTHHYSHMYPLDIFISAGFIGLLMYGFINGLIIKNYKIFLNDKNLQYIFVAYVVTILYSCYDITTNYYSGFIILMFLQLFLLQNISDRNIIAFRLVPKLFLFSIAVIINIFFFFIPHKSHIDNYNDLVKNYSLLRNIEYIKKIQTDVPHYGEIDTIFLYAYTFQAPDLIKKDIFIDALDYSSKYNRYYDSRLFFASKYYSFEMDTDNITTVYSDIFRKILIQNRFFNWVNSDIKDHITIIHSEKYISFDKKTMSLIVSNDLFETLINLNKGGYVNVNDVSSHLKLHIDNQLSFAEKNLVISFIDKITNYSRALNF